MRPVGSSAIVRFDGREARVRAARTLLMLSLALAVAVLTIAPLAEASTTLTWSGKASDESLGWSQESNWVGGLAPSSSPVSLTFPELGSECDIDEPTDACYESEDDVSGLTVESMQIDDGGFYELFGEEPLTLGSGGLRVQPEGATPGYAFVDMPIALGTSQTWDLSGTNRTEIERNVLLLEGELTGSDSNLTLNTSDGLGLLIGANVQVGALSIEGADASGEKLQNAVVELGGGGRLNSVDGEAVSLSHVYFTGSGQLGALHTSDATIVLGNGTASPGKLEATSATLDPGTGLLFEVPSTSTTPGVGYAQFASDGSIDLDSAVFGMYVPKLREKACPSFAPGQSFTFVTTTGTLSGEFANAPNGSEVAIDFAEECDHVAQTIQVDYHETGGTETVTGVVEAARHKQEEETTRRKREQEEEASKRKQEEEANKKLAEERAKKLNEETAAREAAALKRREEELTTAFAKYREEEEAQAAARAHQEEEAKATALVKGTEGKSAAKGKSAPLTRAEKLAKALKQCKQETKKKRAGCVLKAKKLYGTKPRKQHAK